MSDIFPIPPPGSMTPKCAARLPIKAVGIDDLPNGVIELALVPKEDPTAAVVVLPSPKLAAFPEFRLLAEREEAGAPPYTPALPD